jgi:hypothetical protein
VGPAQAASRLAGLVPSSGGTEDSNPDARSGVNDGDNEVAASSDPKSVGFTDSDVYLETDRPSLYDAFSDMYGEPVKPRKKQERMMALANSDVREQAERPAENLQAGREFSAIRNRPRQDGRRPSEREARALLYVKGPTPAHLALVAYGHFDGHSWHELAACEQACPLATTPQPSPRIRLLWPASEILGTTVTHKIKVGTLASSPMPVPPHVCGFRVGQIDRPDFFSWSQEGILRMADRSIPGGTVIETESHTIRPESLRRVEFPSGRYTTQENDRYGPPEEVAALATSWTSGIPRGWAQVEAVVTRLLSHAVHDRAATLPQDCPDAVAHFLLRSRRGADYQFAGAAAVLLDSLGYTTRVVSGLYAAPGKYDARTRHTPIREDGVHFWAEVRLPDGIWVPIEPTPGYELMSPPLALSERLSLLRSAVFAWARAHVVGLAGLVVMLVVAFRVRHEIVDRLATAGWWLSGLVGSPRRQVLRTVRLLDHRSRRAGRGRPSCLTPRRWLLSLAAETEPGPSPDLVRLFDLANGYLYGVPHGLAGAQADPVGTTAICRNAARHWTLRRFRSTTASASGGWPRS